MMSYWLLCGVLMTQKIFVNNYYICHHSLKVKVMKYNSTSALSILLALLTLSLFPSEKVELSTEDQPTKLSDIKNKWKKAFSTKGITDEIEKNNLSRKSNMVPPGIICYIDNSPEGKKKTEAFERGLLLRYSDVNDPKVLSIAKRLFPAEKFDDGRSGGLVVQELISAGGYKKSKGTENS